MNARAITHRAGAPPGHKRETPPLARQGFEGAFQASGQLTEAKHITAKCRTYDARRRQLAWPYWWRAAA